MSLNLLKPIYPYRPISSLRALAGALRVSEQALIEIAGSADQMYRKVKPKPGSSRQTFDANAPLKPLHARIKNTILAKVEFPNYLTGSLKGRDYKTNADLHTNKSVVICEDVKGFFNSVSTELVYDLWRNFFKFAPEVAQVLTQLTTKDGALPQGGIPSSFLANLVLWRDEPLLQAKLQARGVTYSRYVDDIAMSSKSPLTLTEKKELIAAVYGMLRKNNLYARRDKHEITPATERMITTKLVVNRNAALPTERRSNARVPVFQVEKMAEGVFDPAELTLALNKAANRVGQLGRFHRNLAKPLKERLSRVRDLLPAVAMVPVITGSPVQLEDDVSTPPWE
ncbi:reverse transcriptase family protein [Variovorax paradoxus]|jgi:hypothetical protein|uniref:reverse transcriptase family protein n=1 Tax=Variovorax paradoxus TaxID=34073 RepID=UPI00339B14D9